MSLGMALWKKNDLIVLYMYKYCLLDKTTAETFKTGLRINQSFIITLSFTDMYEYECFLKKNSD